MSYVQTSGPAGGNVQATKVFNGEACGPHPWLVLLLIIESGEFCGCGWLSFEHARAEIGLQAHEVIFSLGVLTTLGAIEVESLSSTDARVCIVGTWRRQK